MSTPIEQQQAAVSDLDDLIEEVPREWHGAFQHFVETGEAEDAFLNYLNGDKQVQLAVERAFNYQAAGFEGLAAELKKSVGTEEQPEAEPLRYLTTISNKIAKAVEKTLQASPEDREKVVEKSAVQIAA